MQVQTPLLIQMWTLDLDKPHLHTGVFFPIIILDYFKLINHTGLVGFTPKWFKLWWGFLYNIFLQWRLSCYENTELWAVFIYHRCEVNQSSSSESPPKHICIEKQPLLMNNPDENENINYDKNRVKGEQVKTWVKRQRSVCVCSTVRKNTDNCICKHSFC